MTPACFPRWFPDWRAKANELGIRRRVHFIERIAEEDLAAVYRGAECFVFPSYAEGFGLTPLEAMACGTPVISSNATSLPEAVGGAGILVEPDDVQGWSAAMLRLVGTSDLRASLKRAGLERAGSFKWPDTGKRVACIIREAARCAS
jgi:glycosyltransferase involved in cell wall biosynthesis